MDTDASADYAPAGNDTGAGTARLEVFEREFFLGLGSAAFNNIFAKQLELLAKISEKTGEQHDPFAMTPAERAVWMTEMSFGLIDEVGETMDNVNWKSWAKDRGEVNLDEALGELVDVLHFWVNLVLGVGAAGGLTPEDLARRMYAGYFDKNAVNSTRQDGDGYDARASKCGACGRAFDDEQTKCTPDHCGYTAA